MIQTKQQWAAREQRNKYKPRTETRTTPQSDTPAGRRIGVQIEIGNGQPLTMLHDRFALIIIVSIKCKFVFGFLLRIAGRDQWLNH